MKPLILVKNWLKLDSGLKLKNFYFGQNELIDILLRSGSN